MLDIISRNEIQIMKDRINKVLNDNTMVSDFRGTTVTPANIKKFLEEHYHFKRVSNFIASDNVTYIENYEGIWEYKRTLIRIQTNIELLDIEIIAGGLYGTV